MRFCTNCGYEVVEGARFCVYCSAELFPVNGQGIQVMGDNGGYAPQAPVEEPTAEIPAFQPPAGDSYIEIPAFRASAGVSPPEPTVSNAVPPAPPGMPSVPIGMPPAPPVGAPPPPPPFQPPGGKFGEAAGELKRGFVSAIDKFKRFDTGGESVSSGNYERVNKFGLGGGMLFSASCLSMVIILAIAATQSGDPLSQGLVNSAIRFLVPAIIILGLGGAVCIFGSRLPPSRNRGIVVLLCGILTPLLLLAATVSKTPSIPMLPDIGGVISRILLILLVAGVGVAFMASSSYVVQSGCDPARHRYAVPFGAIGAGVYFLGIILPLWGGRFSVSVLSASMSVFSRQLSDTEMVEFVMLAGSILLMLVAGGFCIAIMYKRSLARTAFGITMIAAHLPIVTLIASFFEGTGSGMDLGAVLGMFLLLGAAVGLFYGILESLIGGMSDIIGPALEKRLGG